MSDTAPPSIPPAGQGQGRSVTSRSLSAEAAVESQYAQYAPSESGPERTPLGTAVEATTGWFRKVSGRDRAPGGYSHTEYGDEHTILMSRDNPPHAAVDPGWSTVQPQPVPPVAPVSSQAQMGTEPGVRRARLVVSRVDPWSAMKLAFLLSFAVGIMSVFATGFVWFALDGLQVFAGIESLVTKVIADPISVEQIMANFSLGKIMAGSMLIAVLNVFLWTAFTTITAFLYNVVAALVGGLRVAVTDE